MYGLPMALSLNALKWTRLSGKIVWNHMFEIFILSIIFLPFLFHGQNGDMSQESRIKDVALRYIYIPTDSTGKPNLFLLAALFALSRIGGQKGSSLGMINDHESCLSNMTIYAVQVLCNKLHERKQWISALQFLTSISQPTFQPTLQLAFQHLKTTAQSNH